MSAAPKGWLIDTNVVSEIRKGLRADPSVRSWAAEVNPEACYISAVTIAEIRAGIERRPEDAFRHEFEDWLGNDVRVWFGKRVLHVTEQVLVAWLNLAAEDGHRARHTYAQPDAMTAATALVHGLGVVTRNTMDFERAGLALINNPRGGSRA